MNNENTRTNDDSIGVEQQERSWIEAREILQNEIREFQAEYSIRMMMSSSSVSSSQETNHSNTCSRNNTYLQFFKQNMDVLWALCCSIVLLLIGSLASDLEMFLSGLLSTTCSLLSLLAIHRHNVMSYINRHASLFEAIQKYLQSSQDALSHSINDVNSVKSSHNDARATRDKEDLIRDENITEDKFDSFFGISPFIKPSYNFSSDGDYYWVFRRVGEGRSVKSRWFKLPNLLIVEGDCIALQVGDIAPSQVKLLRDETIQMNMGEKVTLSHDPLFANKLPLGKSTFVARDDKDASSNKLLPLAQNMQIYLVCKTPLRTFLKDATENRTNLRSENEHPLTHRKMSKIRKHLQIMSATIFVTTFSIILMRFGTNIVLNERGYSKDWLALPFLAALCASPVSFPIIIYLMEAIGTGRILRMTHTLSVSHDQENKAWSSKLVLAYIYLTLRCRFLPRINFRKLAIDHQEQKHTNVLLNSSDKYYEPIPPSSWSMVEKLASASALSLIDDELVCEDRSTPQQLLIPSSQGLKLLDLYPKFLENLDENEDDSLVSSDSDSTLSDDVNESNINTLSKRTRRLLNIRRKLLSRMKLDQLKDRESDDSISIESRKDEYEVQFEDPLWWKFLPSLKAIGLACLLINQNSDTNESQEQGNTLQHEENETELLQKAQSSLIPHICRVQSRSQLVSLAHCIGFTHDLKDIEYFTERRRLHIVSTKLLHERITMDSHALGLEEGRGRGLLRPDSTSVVVHDMRTKAFQLLTVGDPLVVSDICSDSWQGENSTIMPLTMADREAILEASKNWNLADLDVAVFSYAPVPHITQKKIGSCGASETAVLIDNRPIIDGETIIKDSGMDWALVNNQIFLGMLGSSIRPRREVKPLLNQCNEAGVRFVYFSPRNMRRTKELASQMGLDVGWNCAISLRDLDEGEIDDHRMPSSYADWDVNAKLPHGVSEVRQHLEEVDDVPLLVGLYTDVTCDTTEDMVTVFREYGDTVVTVGLVHGSRRLKIFKASDLAIGVDLLRNDLYAEGDTVSAKSNNFPKRCDFKFVTDIAAHCCAFRLQGASAIDKIPDIIEIGRASYDAIYNGISLILCGYLSLAFTAFFSSLSISRCIPFIPPLGALFYLLLVLPILGIALAFTDSLEGSMQHVPAKNENENVFPSHEKKSIYVYNLVRSLLPCFGAHLLYLTIFGELLLSFEPSLAEACASNNSWFSILKCGKIDTYTGPARSIASALMLSELALCSIVLSPGFIAKSKPLRFDGRFSKNRLWLYSTFLSLALIIIYIIVCSNQETREILSWYSFFIMMAWPFLCLGFSEFLKKYEEKDEARADMLRRLQFETRLGMWSPK